MIMAIPVNPNVTLLEEELTTEAVGCGPHVS